MSGAPVTLLPSLQFKESALRKQSLYLKFDPLLQDSPRGPAPVAPEPSRCAGAGGNPIHAGRVTMGVPCHREGGRDSGRAPAVLAELVNKFVSGSVLFCARAAPPTAEVGSLIGRMAHVSRILTPWPWGRVWADPYARRQHACSLLVSVHGAQTRIPREAPRRPSCWTWTLQEPRTFP